MSEVDIENTTAAVDEWLDERDMARARAAREGEMMGMATQGVAPGGSVMAAQFVLQDKARAIGALFGESIADVLHGPIQELAAAGEHEINLAEREVYQVTGKLQDVETELAVTKGLLRLAQADYLLHAHQFFPSDAEILTDAKFIEQHGPEWMHRVHRYLG